MNEKPILFKPELVRAILENKKSQTRRIVKPQPIGQMRLGLSHSRYGIHALVDNNGSIEDRHIVCPYGGEGGRLWVRETWGIGSRPDPNVGDIQGIEYKADEAYCPGESDILPLYQVEMPPGETLDEYDRGHWRPSIFMPRWASRLTLKITSVSVERVCDITEEDAKAEGFPIGAYNQKIATIDTNTGDVELHERTAAREAFEQAWKQMHGEDSWNSFVWVVKFEKIENV